MSSTHRFPPWLQWGGVALFLAWLFFALISYYVVQKPFDPLKLAALATHSADWLRFSFSLSAVFRSLLDVLTAVSLSLIALGVGYWILDGLFRPINLSALARGVLAMGAGFGAIGIAVLLLGMAGWLQTAVLYTFTLLLALIALPKLIPFLRQARPTAPPRWLAVYLFLALGMALFVALLPPTSFDGLLYHLTGPKLYLQAGGIYPGIDNPPLYFPFLFEMLYLWGMGLRGDVAAQLLHFVFLFMVAGLVYAIARDSLGLKDGWTAVIFFFSIPMALTFSTWAYVDLGLVFCQVAAIYTFSLWQQNRHPRGLAFSGAWAGLAMGFKYTSFITPVTLVLLIAWEYRREWRAAIRPLLVFGITAVLVGCPWYIKNWLFTGNPTYPFVFGGQFWDDFRSTAYAASGTGIGLDPVALLRLPYDLILGWKDAAQDGFPGAWPLIFLPLFLLYSFTHLGKEAPATFRHLLLFALAQFAFWTVGVISSHALWQVRLLLSAFVALCPAMAWIFHDLPRFDHPQFSLRRFVNMALVFSFALNLVGQLLNWLPLSPWNYVLGTDSREQVLTNLLGLHYQAMQSINQLPANSNVVLLWEPRSYYCDRPCHPDTLLHDFPHLEYLYGDAPGIANAWREQGVTHILAYEGGFRYLLGANNAWLRPKNANLWAELQQNYLLQVENWQDVYVLYQIQPQD